MSIVKLMCREHIGPRHYLEGRPVDGTVGLARKANNNDPTFSGTVWYIE